MTRGRLQTSQTFTPPVLLGLLPRGGVGKGSVPSPQPAGSDRRAPQRRRRGAGGRWASPLASPSVPPFKPRVFCISTALRHPRSFLRSGRTSILLPVERVWSRGRRSPVLGLLLGTRGTPSSAGRKSSKLEARETSWPQGSPDQPPARRLSPALWLMGTGAQQPRSPGGSCC